MRAKRVVTFHDVTFFRMPERYPPARRLYFRTMTRLSARVADAIIVPSTTVRDDTAAVLSAPMKKLHVVYEAAAARYRPIPADEAGSVARRYGIEGPYVLSVGSLEPGKNRARLIRAVRDARDAGVDVTLAVAGQPAWRHEAEHDLADQVGIGDRVRWLGYVPPDDLPALYSGAAVFAFPSLYEGFGLPVLEAMACGTPVLTSDVSATAEVAGDAALLVNPRSVTAISEGLRRLLEDDALRAQLRARGLARAAEFSWRRAAEETYAVYRSVTAG
jgi:glycosyltransferase involved in cell wall biosynthesis